MENLICAVRKNVNGFNTELLTSDIKEYRLKTVEVEITVFKCVTNVSEEIKHQKNFLGFNYIKKEVKTIPVYKTRINVRGGGTSEEYFIDDNLELYNFVADNVAKREREVQEKIINKFCGK